VSGGVHQRWNHNIHYHRLVLGAVPVGARSALDVGTGNGLLAADLRKLVPEVTGIDIDEDVLESAKLEDATVQWIHGDVMSHPFRPGSFDVVASVATVHHLADLAQTLRRFADLTAPGGVVAVVGIGRTSRGRDVLLHLAGLAQHTYLRWRRGLWEHSAPLVWPPPHTYAEARRTARAVLPGCRWKQLPMWRYALLWNKPVEP
jgi:2-polyprenyl-3-methyl-5-hydroxy-6-metoxy-1,4-benzoquinol methylase